MSVELVVTMSCDAVGCSKAVYATLFDKETPTEAEGRLRRLAKGWLKVGTLGTGNDEQKDFCPDHAKEAIA